MKLLSLCFITLITFFIILVDARVSVRGYYRKSGTYVAPHYRSSPDRSFHNNWSTKGNTNPYTGKMGTKSYPSSSYTSRNYINTPSTYSAETSLNKYAPPANSYTRPTNSDEISSPPTPVINDKTEDITTPELNSDIAAANVTQNVDTPNSEIKSEENMKEKTEIYNENDSESISKSESESLPEVKSIADTDTQLHKSELDNLKSEISSLKNEIDELKIDIELIKASR